MDPDSRNKVGQVCYPPPGVRVLQTGERMFYLDKQAKGNLARNFVNDEFDYMEEKYGNGAARDIVIKKING